IRLTARKYWHPFSRSPVAISASPSKNLASPLLGSLRSARSASASCRNRFPSSLAASAPARWPLSGFRPPPPATPSPVPSSPPPLSDNDDDAGNVDVDVDVNVDVDVDVGVVVDGQPLVVDGDGDVNVRVDDPPIAPLIAPSIAFTPIAFASIAFASIAFAS